SILSPRSRTLSSFPPSRSPTLMFKPRPAASWAASSPALPTRRLPARVTVLLAGPPRGPLGPPPQAITDASGGRRDQRRTALEEGAVLTGRLLDESGQPLPAARVMGSRSPRDASSSIERRRPLGELRARLVGRRSSTTHERVIDRARCS